MTILFTEPSFVPVSGNSVVYPGAKLFFYETGTSNLQNTYSEYTLTTAHANPVVADANGRFAPIYLDPGLEDYKVVLKDSSDVTIWTVDPYSAVKNTTALATMSALLSASTALSTVSINGYHTEGDGGGGEFYWDSSQDKANHNGGTIIDPDITFPTDWTNQTQLATWFTAGSGSGCWVRINQYGEYNAKHFGAKGDGSTNDYLAIKSIIDTIPNRARPLTLGGAWEYAGAYVIYLPPSTTEYISGTKLTIPAEKNIMFVTDSASGAVIKYTGSSNFVIEFLPGSISKSIGCINMGIKDGGVSVVGTNGGDIRFEHCYFYNSPDFGLYFVDGPDYTDGDEYVNPGDFAGANSGINTVFVTMEKCQFHYCNKGIGIYATTVLLFNCFKPRFNGTTNAPMTINATGVTVTEPEFQGVVNRSTVPYIHFPLTNPTSHIFFNGGRFGSEEFSIAQYSGRSFGPPDSSILFGEFGAYSAPAEVATNLVFKQLVCESDNVAPKDTDHLAWLAGDVRRLKFEDCTFTNYQSYLINEVAFDGDGTIAQECEFRNCERVGLAATGSLPEWFSSGGQGWTRTEERLEFVQTDAPFASASTHTGTFVDGNVTVGTDRIAIAAHGFVSSQLVQLTTTGTLPTGLATSTNYYVKRIDADTIELYTTAVLSTIVDITAAAGGGTHTITGQGTAGTGASVSIGSGSNDARGTLTVTTGTSPSAGNLFTLQFYREYAKAPKIMLMAANANAGGLNMNVATSTTYGVTVRSGTTPAGSTAYIFDYIVVG